MDVGSESAQNFLPLPRHIVIKKTMSHCSIWQGLWAAAQERRYICVHKRGNSSPLSKYRWFSVYSMNKTGGRRKMFVTMANAASWLSSCWAPSQFLLRPIFQGGIVLWLWVLALSIGRSESPCTSAWCTKTSYTWLFKSKVNSYVSRYPITVV
jgi:hypothetical protein